MRCPRCADFVAEVFCPSECVRLIQDQASMRNVDSRIHSLRFDCCVFLFYSFSAVTFATKSALSCTRDLQGWERCHGKAGSDATALIPGAAECKWPKRRLGDSHRAYASAPRVASIREADP